MSLRIFFTHINYKYGVRDTRTSSLQIHDLEEIHRAQFVLCSLSREYCFRTRDLFYSFLLYFKLKFQVFTFCNLVTSSRRKNKRQLSCILIISGHIIAKHECTLEGVCV